MFASTARIVRHGMLRALRCSLDAQVPCCGCFRSQVDAFRRPTSLASYALRNVWCHRHVPGGGRSL